MIIVTNLQESNQGNNITPNKTESDFLPLKPVIPYMYLIFPPSNLLFSGSQKQKFNRNSSYML